MSRRPLPTMPRKLDPIPGRDARDEQTMGMIIALTSEITILRARLDACERLLVDAGVLPAGAIDGFAPGATAQEERNAMRTRSIAKIMRPMHELAQQELAELPLGATTVNS